MPYLAELLCNFLVVRLYVSGLLQVLDGTLILAQGTVCCGPPQVCLDTQGIVGVVVQEVCNV
jgi:hypothetical protein